MKKQKVAVLIAAVLWGVASGASALTSAPTDSVQGRAPTLTGAKFSHVDVNNNGVIDLGDKLTISDEGFADADGDTAVDSEYLWYRNGAQVVSVSTNTYTLTADDLGTEISARVIPKTDDTITDPSKGIQYVVDGSPDGNQTVEVADATTVSKVEIVLNDGSALVGNPIVDTVLKAKVTTSDGGEVTDTSLYTYKWMIEDSAGSNNYIIIPGANSETYTVLKGDQKRKLQVEVTKN